MKALMKCGKGKEGIQLVDIPKPTPKDDEILIKVMAAGICGTDIHIMLDEYPYCAPVVMGHEYTGTVEEVGAAVTDFSPGDQVISLTAVITCAECRYCKNGLLMLCNERKSIGSGVNGAMAEYVAIPARLAYRISNLQNFGEELALAEPLACCVRAVIERSPVKAGDVAVVSGPGVIGQLTAQLAKLQGAFVILSGIPADEERLKLALSMKTADKTVTSTEELDALLKQYSPDGADVVYECAGAPASMANCLRVVRKGGHYAQVGLFGKEISVDMDRFLTKELSFSTSYATEPSSWDILINLLNQGKINLAPLANPVFPLEQWSEAFDAAVNKVGYKTILKP